MSNLKSLLLFAQRAFDAMCGLCLLITVFVLANVGAIPSLASFLSARITVKNELLVCLFLGVWNGAFALIGRPTLAARPDLFRQMRIIAGAAAVGALPLMLFVVSSRSGAFTASVILIFWVLATIVEIAGRMLLSHAARWVSRNLSPVKVLIVGSGPRAARVLARIEERRTINYDVVGVIDDREAEGMPPLIATRLVGRIADLERLLAATAVDRVVIALPMRSSYEAIQAVLDVCERMGVEVEQPLDFFRTRRARVSQEPGPDLPAVRLTHVVQDHRVIVKRAVDLVVGAIALVVLSPVFLVCAALVRLGGPGPIIFRQQRYGFNRRRFPMLKFRTMVVDAEAKQAALEDRNEVDGPVFKIRNDPRITAVGRFLRKTSLDELPQLVNVLRGEMSLVGPRPLPLRDVSRFTEASLMRRFSVKPGLTCLWQINGRSDTSFGQWIKHDLEYIDHWSLALDFEILAKTIPAVLRGSGAA